MVSSCLVTGGCGFIGTNLIPQLIARGISVRVLDDLSLGRREDIERFDVELIIGDIRDRRIAANALRGQEAVVHLAAHTRVVESVENPCLNFEVNAVGTFNLLMEAKIAGVKKFVFASTGGAILGEQTPPVHENMVPKPLAPYGASKLAGEAYCSAFAGAYGIDAVALRFSNVYGPFSYHKASVVAQFLKCLLLDQPLVVYGDGAQTRDFLFVEDLVGAVMLALGRDTTGEVFQIASGVETSVTTLLELIQNVVGREHMNVRYEPARKGEVSRNFACVQKAADMLDFRPETALKDGLARTWEWFQERRGDFF